jgi:hypothetical protein
MWQELALATPTSNAAALNTVVQLIEISPFNDGENNALSFPNASELLVLKMNQSQQSAVLAIGVAGLNLRNFASKCAALNSAFALKQFALWSRIANSIADSETTKWDLPPPQATSTMIRLDSIGSVRAQKRLDLIANALTALNTPSQPLTVSPTDYPTVDNSPLDAWLCYSESDFSTDLTTGLSTLNDSFTVSGIVAFIGSSADLALLREFFA